MATGAVEEVVEVGYFGAGQFIPCDELSAGMVGYITASIKMFRIRELVILLQIMTDLYQSRFQVIRRSTLWCTAVCIQQTVQNIRI